MAESQPNLLEIGSSQDETKKLLHDHELLLAKLKVRASDVKQRQPYRGGGCLCSPSSGPHCGAWLWPFDDDADR